MLKLPSMALLVSLGLFTGCAQLDGGSNPAPERGDPNYLKGVDTRADELYINATVPEGARDFRNVYIAQADLTGMRVIQPEGEIPDESWQVTSAENTLLQAAIKEEFGQALGYHSAYNIVDDIGQADIVINTAVVAIHPNATRAQVEAGAQRGGAITVSVAVANGTSGEVMVRTVDTKSTEDIWAFNNVDDHDPAINLIFRSWGNSLRRGMLQLQARTDDPLAPVIQLQQQ